MRYYAGIGSRDTPTATCLKMTEIASILEEKGFILRSGGARGADRAFEKGVANPSNKEIFYAEDVTKEAIAHAKEFHPAWGRLDGGMRKLMGRNSQILLGKELLQPVEFVVCWTPFGDWVGGTSQGMRIAYTLNIPIYNLWDNFVNGPWNE